MIDDEFREALANAPRRDLSVDPIAGLPSDQVALLARLRRITDRMPTRDPKFMAEIELSTLEMLGGGDGTGPWQD